QFLAHAVRSTQLETLRCWIDDVDGSGLSARQLHSLGNDGGQNGGEIERGVYRLRHFAKGTQLPHGLRKLMTACFQFVRSLLHLLSRAGMGFLEVARHSVELIRERLKLVPRLDGDSLAEVATAEPSGAQPQSLDRADHAAGEKHPGKDGNAKRGQQHEGESLQSRVKGRIGLLGR